MQPREVARESLRANDIQHNKHPARQYKHADSKETMENNAATNSATHCSHAVLLPTGFNCFY
jgi:hypothetical protein